MLPKVLDGATGTALLARGLAAARLHRAPLEAPDTLRAVHRAQREAGAGALTTGSFGLPSASLRGEGDASRLAHAAASLAVEVAQGLPVLGSLGPAARAAEGAPYGGLARSLEDGGVTHLQLETFVRFDAALAALGAVRGASRLPVVVLLSPSDPARTADGVPWAEVFARLRNAGAAAVGLNCGEGPASLAAVARAHPGLVLRPSTGLPSARLAPSAFAAALRELAEAGAMSVGGCCGAGAPEIRALMASWSP